ARGGQVQARQRNARSGAQTHAQRRRATSRSGTQTLTPSFRALFSKGERPRRAGWGRRPLEHSLACFPPHDYLERFCFPAQILPVVVARASRPCVSEKPEPHGAGRPCHYVWLRPCRARFIRETRVSFFFLVLFALLCG